MAEAGEPLLRLAIQATRLFNEAKAQGRPASEVERLRIKADHLYKTVVDYQLHRAGALGQPVH